MSMTLLQLEAVSKSYGERLILDRISLKLAPGQTIALIGSSGSGKSTLLRLINGLIPPDSGRVIFQGRALEGDQNYDYRRQMGYVLQEGGLFPHLTIEENLGLLARDQGWNSRAILERVMDLIGLLRLPNDCLSRYPGQLSGGQRQRASIARALFLSPPLLLLDEPLGALDPPVRRQLQDELKELFRQLQCGVVLVTHDLAEAAHFAHSICLLEAGRLVDQGSFADLVERSSCSFQAMLHSHRALPC
ncbi:MAG: ATP-binding cassette domain-containing protein [Candidatus Eremiobacteraeota bacterium]|nr:ATP-binding cassette domain-containing protein [Candidatus Eremiobacteraeota bacterium]MCW5870934.1 ATP-binding cassette domain-containing protein [Candidatus Eremiobacteraeota bacterium]